MDQGTLKIQNKNFVEALEYFNKLIKLDNQNIKAYSLRGYINNQLNDFDGAISDFSRIIVLQPNNSGAYDNRGICKKNKGDYQGALVDYSKAIQLDNQNASAYCNRAVLKYDFLNDKDGACADWAISKQFGLENTYINSNGKCEKENGVLKTKTGVMLYINQKDNYFTLNLHGEADLSKFPLVKLDGKYFQFKTFEITDSTKTNDELLNDFMNWEIEYFQNSFKSNIETKNEVISINGKDFNFWNFKNPVIKLKKTHTRVINTFFIDFIIKDCLYRFVYASSTGDEIEAKTYITTLINNMHHYNSHIILEKLQNSIINGEDHYLEK